MEIVLSVAYIPFGRFPLGISIRFAYPNIQQSTWIDMVCMIFFTRESTSIKFLINEEHCTIVVFLVKNLIIEFHCMDFNHKTGMNN